MKILFLIFTQLFLLNYAFADFAEGTKIELNDGSLVPIQDIHSHVRVSSVQFQNGTLEKKDTLGTMLFSSTAQNLLRLVLSNGRELEVSGDQPIVNGQLALIKATDFKVGDSVLMGDGKTMKVSAVYLHSGVDKSYHFYSTRKSLIIANGIVVGDYLTEANLTSNW